VYATGPSEITRQDRQRYIAVAGVPQGRSVGDSNRASISDLLNMVL